MRPGGARYCPTASESPPQLESRDLVFNTFSGRPPAGSIRVAGGPPAASPARDSAARNRASDSQSTCDLKPELKACDESPSLSHGHVTVTTESRGSRASTMMLGHAARESPCSVTVTCQ